MVFKLNMLTKSAVVATLVCGGIVLFNSRVRVCAQLRCARDVDSCRLCFGCSSTCVSSAGRWPLASSAPPSLRPLTRTPSPHSPRLAQVLFGWQKGRRGKYDADAFQRAFARFLNEKGWYAPASPTTLTPSPVV